MSVSAVPSIESNETTKNIIYASKRIKEKWYQRLK